MQAAAAMQAERMRRTLEARAVVAQVAEQKEAGRAAIAAAQVDLHVIHFSLKNSHARQAQKAQLVILILAAHNPCFRRVMLSICTGSRLGFLQLTNGAKPLAGVLPRPNSAFV